MDGFELGAAQPYEIRGTREADGALAGPLIFASPHSGRIYPEAMMAASALDGQAIRRSEDAFVDELIAGALACGAVTIANRYARAYVDVNRQPYELDPAMFEDALPSYAIAKGPRILAGLGAVPRIVADGQEIYARKLAVAEAVERIETVHAPYHAALADLVQQALREHGRAIVVDWHSMPSAAGTTARGVVDFVLGDRFGQACDGALTAVMETSLRDLGYRVVRNNPYAGGYTTERYGRPRAKVHVLQVEINRALYLDEAALTRSDGFARLEGDLGLVFAALGQAVAQGRL